MIAQTFKLTLMQKLLGRNYKWWYLFLNAFKSQSAYKFDNLYFFIGRSIYTLSIIFVWWLNTKDGNGIFTFNFVVNYFLIGQLLSIFSQTNGVQWYLANKIETGMFARILLLPGPVFKHILFNTLGLRVWETFIESFFMLIILMLFKNEIILSNYILLVPIFIVVAFFIRFFLEILIGCIAFWTVKIWGFSSIISNIWTFCAGELFPLNVLSVLSFTLYTPFAFTFYHPMQIYLGKYSPTEILYVFLGGIAWCVVLYFLAKLVFKAGLKRNESVGL